MAAAVANLSSQATVDEVEVCGSSASSGVEERPERQGSPAHTVQGGEDIEQNAQRRDYDEPMRDEPRPDSLGAATLQMRGAEAATQYFGIMAHDAATEIEGGGRGYRKEHTDATGTVAGTAQEPADTRSKRRGDDADEGSRTQKDIADMDKIDRMM